MRALNAAPENNALLRETIDALTENRVSTPALWLSQSAAMSPAERRRLERNAAAERVRLADVPGRTEKERLRLAQNALDRYHTLLSRWQNDPQAAEDVVLARIDRLGALYAQGNYRQVISEYEALTAAQHPVPDWAIGWVISAYLQEKNTVAAFSLVQRYPHYASDPQDEEHALFYAWLDTGQYQTARRYVERETRSVPGPATISDPRPLSRTIGGSPDSLSNLTICWRPTPCRRPKSCRIVWHQRRREIRGYRLIMPPCFRPEACRARPSKSLNEQRRLNPRIWSLKNSRLTSQWTFRSGVRWIYWLMT